MAAPRLMPKEELPPNIVMKDCNTFYCKCCSCILGGIGCMKQHVAGKRHNKEMQRIGISVTPTNETVEAGNQPTEDFFSFALPPGVSESGVVESKDRWKSFYCTYCSCELGAIDMKIHVVGKRHTKRANKAALESYISKQERKDTFEVRDGKMAREAINVTEPEAKDSSNLQNISSGSASPVKKVAHPVNVPTNTESQTNASVENVSESVSLNVSAKEDLCTNALVTDVSKKDASQHNVSENFSQTSDSLKTAEDTVSRKSPPVAKSIDNNSQHFPENITQQAAMPVNTSLHPNDSGKGDSQSPTNSTDCKTSSSVAVTPAVASQGKTPMKVASQPNKSALLKIVPQAKFSSKPVLQTTQLKTSLSEYFATVSNPIVGLNYVEEMQMEDGQSVFRCNLCDVGGDADVIKDHINAAKHHLEYLRTVDPIKAAEVKDLKDTERNQKILEHVIELEKKKGRGTILVKTAKMKTSNTGGENYHSNSESAVLMPVKNFESSILDKRYADNSSIQIVAQEFLTKDVIRNAQSRDPKTSKVIKELTEDVPNSSHVMHDGILYERRNGKYRVVVAEAMKQAIYESYHYALCRKTPGGVTYINDSYSWSGINEDIARFAKQCYICQIRKLRQFSDGEAIPILVRRRRDKKISTPAKRAFNDLTNEEIEDTQRKDPDTTKLISDVENGLETNKYIIYENILYITDENGQYKIVVSSPMKKLIFEKNHTMLCWKSTERPPLINAITQVYFWQRMLEEVKSFAAKCKKCRVSIPVKRLADQKTTVAPSAKITKKTTDKSQDEANKGEQRRKSQQKTSKDTQKERARERDKSKEKPPRSSSWDKTKNLKPPIVEQDILAKDMVRDAQKKDLTTSKIIKLLMDGIPSSSYILYEGVLYQEKNGKYLTMVADKMKQAIYEKCHSSLCSRHTSHPNRSSRRNGTRYISRHFSWVAMSQDIYIFTKNCHVCQVKILRTKAFSLSKDHSNNRILASASRSAFNDLTDDEITNFQQKDPDSIKILHQIEDGMHVSRYILYEDILYHQGAHGDYKIVTTPEMKEMIYQNNHILLCWESTLWQDTVEMVAQIYLWPRIYEDIRDFMETCQTCKRDFPEQSYSEPASYGAAFADGDKTSTDVMEQYSSYSDPAYCSSAQQYQSNAVQPSDPYSAANSDSYSSGSYPPYWNTSSDTSAYGSRNSGKRPVDEDMANPVSYSMKKRHRSDKSDVNAEYGDKHHVTPFEAKAHLDQNMPFGPMQDSLHSQSSYQSHEAENSSNVLGFTISNAEDAEVTLDIINSLMQIYLKYQLKKLHGPVQKLLQESLEGNKATTPGESSVSDKDIDTTELFVRLPRLKKEERADVTEAKVCPVTSFREHCKPPSFGHPLHNQSMYTSASSTVKSGKSGDTLSRSSSSSERHETSKIDKSFPLQNKDDIDGFPMTSETSDIVRKVRSRWDDDTDDIDGKPLLADSDNGQDVSMQRNILTHTPERRTSLSLSKSLQSKNNIDDMPLGFRTNNSSKKLQMSSDILFKKPSSSSDKLETAENENKDGVFLKPDSSKIFKKPPDDWDKNANKNSAKIKNNPSTKQKSKWNEGSEPDILDKGTLSDKYPNWKKGETQGGSSFYNSPLYSKVDESGSASNSNAPVIDLFRRYRRVKL